MALVYCLLCWYEDEERERDEDEKTKLEFVCFECVEHYSLDPPIYKLTFSIVLNITVRSADLFPGVFALEEAFSCKLIMIEFFFISAPFIKAL